MPEYEDEAGEAQERMNREKSFSNGGYSSKNKSDALHAINKLQPHERAEVIGTILAEQMTPEGIVEVMNEHMLSRDVQAIGDLLLQQNGHRC